MSRLRFCFIAAVLCSLAVLGHGETIEPKPETIVLPISSSTSQTVSPQLVSTPVSTKQSSETVNPAPITDVKPVPDSNTTVKPDTTTAPPTTPAPAPSPTPAPTPAPAPGPVGPPQQGMWSFTDNKNVTCILVQFAAQLNVTYTKGVNATLTYVLLNVPPSALIVDGSCNSTDQWVTLSWPADNTTTVNSTYNNMVLAFHANASTKTYSLRNLNVSLVPEMFPNATNTKNPVELWHGVEWTTSLATSYRCAAATQLKMAAEISNEVATLTLSKLQEEAFRTTPDKTFSAARECSGNDVPDAVPIAVGCALGALVVVVLVAYLVARRRSAAQGYLSM